MVVCAQANLRMFKKLSAIEALDSSSFLLPSHTRSGLATKWVRNFICPVGLGRSLPCLPYLSKD